MNVDRFLDLLKDPAKTKDDLLAMRKNAIAKRSVEHVHLAERVLDERFPTWRSVTSRKGGSKPIEAMFMATRHQFPSEKEAYVWLIERFTTHYPKPFEHIDWQTAFVAKGTRTLYFAKSLTALFRTSPDLALDPQKHHRLANGWYAKLVLSEKQKVELLMKLAAVASLRIGIDWDWDRRGASSPEVSPDEVLREFLNPTQTETNDGAR